MHQSGAPNRKRFVMLGLNSQNPNFPVIDDERAAFHHRDVMLVTIGTPGGPRGVILRKGAWGRWTLMPKIEFNVPDFPEFYYGRRAHYEGLRACDTESAQRDLVVAAGLNILGDPIGLPAQR